MNGGGYDRVFVVHGTVADPGFLDLTICVERSRPWHVLGCGRRRERAACGSRPCCTLRCWLSNWSIDTTNADARKHHATVAVPLLFVNGTADQGIRASHTDELWDAVVSESRQRVDIKGGDHYFTEGETRAQALAVVADWLTDQDLR
jgi:alpha-beta hydrolase superfamily lysophospholipase